MNHVHLDIYGGVGGVWLLWIYDYETDSRGSPIDVMVLCHLTYWCECAVGIAWDCHLSKGVENCSWKIINIFARW